MTTADKPTYSWKEIRQHTSPEDAWIVIHGQIYDVSSWYDHPGGSVIFSHAGLDATDIFSAFHHPSTFHQLRDFHIGKVEAKSDALVKSTMKENEKEFLREFRELRMKIKKHRLDNASSLYYIWKVLSTLSIGVIAFLLAVASDTVLWSAVAAIILGFFYQQCGWLAHDFLHHQVFAHRMFGTWMGIFIGNVCQGFSVHWWKMKHNTHHAVPNVEAIDEGHGDPDIDTMPLLAWSLQMASSVGKSNVLQKWMIKYQAILYFPILLLARFSWNMQSFAVAFNLKNLPVFGSIVNEKNLLQYRALEQFGLCLHLLWNGVLYVLISMKFGVIGAMLSCLLTQTTAGLLLALAFGVGHNGCQIIPKHKLRESAMNFTVLQISTTRNISSSWFIDWFMGGLQYQVEHHLFPTIPRHELGKINKLLVPLYKKYNIAYRETTFWEGTLEITNHLQSIATDFVHEFPAL